VIQGVGEEVREIHEEEVREGRIETVSD